MSGFLEIPQADFESAVIHAEQPVIVEFGAPWCVPCKRVEPILEDLSENEWGGKVKLIKINVDESPDLAMKFSVMGVPTVILFVDGTPSTRLTGNQSKKRFLKKFSQFIA